MSVSSRLTVSVHILCLLALSQDDPATSEYIAGSVNTNPVFIRRLLGMLRQTGLVCSRPGVKGGWELVCDPTETTLLDVYRAVEESPLFTLHSQQPNPNCPVGGNIQQVLNGYFQQVETAMEAALAKVTIAAVLSSVLARAG